MLTDDILKALIEGIIYIAPEPVSLDAIVKVLEGEERERIKAKLDELVADYEQNSHGIQIRQVANGYKFSTKAEHHEVLRKYVKSLKPAVRLSKPALETLAVIAYRQPVTIPEIDEVRGVDSGGVIHTLLEKKLVVTSGRKSVVGRPILYRTSRDFLVHFGLKDVGELPSLKEFEELAKRALGSEWAGEGTPAPSGEPGLATGEPAPAPTPAAEATTDTNAPADTKTVEPAPGTPQEAPNPVAEDSTTQETPPVTEAAPAITEEKEAESAEGLPAPREEAVPASDEPITAASPDVEPASAGSEPPSTAPSSEPLFLPVETPSADDPDKQKSKDGSPSAELPPPADEHDES
jgi:segregation and condensation protein B